MIHDIGSFVVTIDADRDSVAADDSVEMNGPETIK